jgi:hypothetical protein
MENSGRILSFCFFLSASVMFPPVLSPVRTVWMGLALVLGAVMSRVVLSVFFYLVLTPMGLVLRMMGRDLMDRKISRDSGSYWKARPARPPEDLEKQF